MLKPTFLFIAIVQSVLLIFSFIHDLSAKESEDNIADSKPRNIAKIIRPSDTEIDLKKVEKVSIVMDSTSPLFGILAGDLLAVKMRDNKFKVTEQAKISEKIAEEVDRIKKETKDEEKQREEFLKIANEIKMAKVLGLDAVFLGTLFEGRRQISFNNEKPPFMMEKIVVSTFCLELIDVKTEKVALIVILEYDKGENIVNAVDTMIKYVLEEVKK